MELEGIRSLAVLGLRRSGWPAALLARRRLPAAQVIALDEGRELPAETREALRAAGIPVGLGAEARLPERLDVLVKSPGVPDSSPLVQAARQRGVTVWSEVELAGRFLPNRIIGITGTNGKTTTTELVGAILRDAGLPVAVGGNVGNALSGMPDVVAPEATIVAELSSFQLEHIERFRVHIGVLLNLTEDHLDRHGSYAAYVAAKLRLCENQGPDDVAICNADDPGTLAVRPALAAVGAGRLVWFSARPGHVAPDLVAGVADDGTLWVEHHGEPARLCHAGRLALKGDHNLQNSLAAAAAGAAAGVPPAAIAATLQSFPGVPHRLQVVATVAGVTYVNDSKATNVDATLKALTAYSGPVHLILGGYDKGASYDELAAAVVGRVKQVLLIGATAPQLAAAFTACAPQVPVLMCGDLAAAVAAAACAAQPGDVVLLSPACASWDQYRDYIARGEHFLLLAQGLDTTGAV